MVIPPRIIFAALLSVLLSFSAFAQENNGGNRLDVSGLDEIISSKPYTAPKKEESQSAQTATQQKTETENVPAPIKKRKGFLEIVHSGGVIGYIIMFLSLASTAFVIEHSLTIRQKILIPPHFAEEVLQMLVQGQLTAAVKKCKENGSVLGVVLASSTTQFEFGWEAVERSAEEAMAEQAAKLYRKVEYLNVIANIAPMLGLLGTVVGMVFAFQQLAESEGYARAADLAEGIYLALVTTVQGLVVAIPSLVAYSFFNNRVAFLMGETIFVAEQVLKPIKKSLAKKER